MGEYWENVIIHQGGALTKKRDTLVLRTIEMWLDLGVRTEFRFFVKNSQSEFPPFTTKGSLILSLNSDNIILI